MLSLKSLTFILVGHMILLASGKGHFKRDTSKESETVLSQLEKIAGGFPIARFESDPVLLQKVQKANSVTKYYLPGNEAVAYERDSDDSNKDVIVFKGEEDKLMFKKLKRVYVVLRRRPENNEAEKIYFANLAFLRVANEKDTNNLVEVNGVKQVIEWATFDEHVVPGPFGTLVMEVHQCASSFIVPCAFNQSALIPSEDFVPSPRYKAKEPSQASVSEERSKKIEIEGGNDPLDNSDLFEDLDLKKVEGRGFMDGVQDVGIVGGLLSGVGGIICGIMSILASCADERAYGNMMPPGMAAQISFAKNPVGALLGRRRKRDAGKILDSEKSLDYPGWKTQFHAPSKDITLKSTKNAKSIFYGLGNCPYVESGPTDLQGAATNDEVVTFYLTKLRTQCISWMKEYVTKLIDIGLINVRDKTLEISGTHPFLSEPKLTFRELIQLTAAAELDAFTTVYVDVSKSSISPPTSKSPDGIRVVSRSANFIITVGLKAIERFGLLSRTHMVHLLRHLLQNYKLIFTKLSQDAQNLQRCKDDCSHDKEINFNDRMLIWAFRDFIKYGLGSVVSGNDAKKRFDQFYTKNVNSIERLVNIYS